MAKLTLTQRLSLVFALLLLVCSGTSGWLQLRASRMHDLEVVQGLSRDVAASIGRDVQLTDANGLMPGAVRNLFSQMMLVNPSVEVYLLDPAGRIVGHAAPEGRLLREQVDLGPVRRFVDGAMLPILGDDPRSADGRKVFSAAPLRVDGREVGFVYVVLLGQAHDLYASRGSAGAVLRTALMSIALVAVLCLAAGLIAFRLITRPLRQLTEELRHFDMQGGAPAAALPEAPTAAGDEIAVLAGTYRQMQARIGEQWQILTRQDQERRELIANVSHDLRTPLSSLHGYLETLLLKDATLDAAERKRYLGIALDQSRKVGTLAQSLFELARLEYGFVQPEPEAFSMTDLVQDVFQKFELAAGAREVALKASFPAQLPAVRADVGMIERVLGNLLDNALRHVPPGGAIEVAMAAPRAGEVEVTVSDTGPGIPPELREGLFLRPFTIGGARRDGGLGLRIVHRMLELNGSRIELLDTDTAGVGASFRFCLPVGATAAVPGLAPAGDSLSLLRQRK
ncbi:HAMP domain-containing sensor histidine kinase [Paucibacter sp. R3-3]|uniref:histidine kinase n=1 Tax=Roseateles agri TaxID=3098619 RepID=A0ABU5DEG0_9BURK|nr:HAMP domain-containing sensor histidine kinase [Paucibacter sp. R3-3]MDY0744658.1 HAMP domain-containing sensor histidine kinase [Paucibacter sp. R3-3]